MLMVFAMTLYLQIRRKSMESKKIDRIDQVCYIHIIVGSIGFGRVVVLAIGLVRKGVVHDSGFRIFWIRIWITYRT